MGMVKMMGVVAKMGVIGVKMGVVNEEVVAVGGCPYLSFAEVEKYEEAHMLLVHSCYKHIYGLHACHCS